MFGKSPELERDLNRFAKDEIGTTGPDLLNPDVVSDKALKTDLRKITRKIEHIDTKISRKEAEREELIEEIAEEPSERQKRLLAQRAGDIAREMDKKDEKCDQLFLRSSLIRGIQHVRSKFEGLNTDLAIDEVLEDEDHEAIAAELEDYLVEQGVENDGLEKIMDTLDMELQRDAESRSQMTDSYAEEALEEAERLEANKDSTKSRAEDIDTRDDTASASNY